MIRKAEGVTTEYAPTAETSQARRRPSIPPLQGLPQRVDVPVSGLNGTGTSQASGGSPSSEQVAGGGSVASTERRGQEVEQADPAVVSMLQVGA